MWYLIIAALVSSLSLCPADELPRLTQKWRLPSYINEYQPTIAPVLSPDGRALYFSRKYYPGNTGGSEDPDDIWVSYRIGDTSWSPPQRLDGINTPASDVLFGFSADGSIAFIHRGTTNGMSGTFALAHRMVSGWEVSPIIIEGYINRSKYYYAFITPDLKTLLLAAEGPDSYGGLDLYISHHIDSLRWSTPINLGLTVNTSGMESSPFLATDKRTLYYASNGFRADSKYDIYITRRLDESWQRWSDPLRLPEPINTEDMDMCWWLFPTGDTVVYVSTDEHSQRIGLYMATLQKQYQPLTTRPTRWQVYFEFNAALLSSLAIPDSILGDLKNASNITIAGHADSIGTDAYNVHLSQRRAEAVRQYLIRTGIPSDRIKIVAYGEARPVASNVTPEGRALNRRVEILWSQ